MLGSILGPTLKLSPVLPGHLSRQEVSAAGIAGSKGVGPKLIGCQGCHALLARARVWAKAWLALFLPLVTHHTAQEPPFFSCRCLFPLQHLGVAPHIQPRRGRARCTALVVILPAIDRLALGGNSRSLAHGNPLMLV